MTDQYIDRSALHFFSARYSAQKSGPKLLVSGAVHGIETCGPIAIRRLMSELDAGQHALICGQLTLVPVVNPLAYAKGTREGDRNLNRNLAPTQGANQFEDHIANWFCPLLAQHQILLDLHSFRSKGAPFVMIGPHNNSDSLEPFQQAELEEALAVRLGVNRVVHGWLSTYAEGVKQRIVAIGEAGIDAGNAGLRAQMDPKYGIGTTEYMRSVGGAALTLECGQNTDPAAPEVAYQAILNTLRFMGMFSGTAPTANTALESLQIYKVIDRHHEGDQFVRQWASFDPLKRNDLIAKRADGTELRAEVDGCILFPDVSAAAHQEWFYLVKFGDRFSRPPET